MLSPEETTRVCLEVQSRFEAISKSEAETEDPPSVLYHYTSAAGLLGIVRTRQIWATNVLHLNDSSELSDAVSFFQRELKSTPIALGSKAKANFDIALAGLSLSAPIEHFVACFCEKGDLLSQWRAYGSQGEGFSAAFRFSALEREVRHKDSNTPGTCRLRKVVYADAEKKEMISKRIMALSEILEPIAPALEHTNAEEFHQLARLSINVGASLHSFISLMKHEAFAEEQEWRIIRTLWNPSRMKQYAADMWQRVCSTERWPVEVRTIRGRLVPYMSISWATEGGSQLGEEIAEVICGPSSHPELTQRSVSDLLTYGNLAAKVSRSKIPLRA